MQGLCYRFVKGDICDAGLVADLMAEVDAVVHFAAETHVDRSNAGADDFLRTNVSGTNTLLEAARQSKVGRFLAVSTDEVYGSIATGAARESDRLNPSNPYSASKAGIIGMSKSLAREVASRGITVNCIAPGFISTPMTDALNEKQTAAIRDAIPAQKFGTPDDIAAAVVYLASPEAAYMTGQTLHINGGRIMT